MFKKNRFGCELPRYLKINFFAKIFILTVAITLRIFLLHYPDKLSWLGPLDVRFVIIRPRFDTRTSITRDFVSRFYLAFFKVKLIEVNGKCRRFR